MARLEDLTRGTSLRGILPDSLVTVVDVSWYGSEAVELTYKDASGRPAVRLLYRDDEATLDVVSTGRPWSFDGDGQLFRLVSEAHRIRLAHLFDPVLAVHTSLVDPLPHQITDLNTWEIDSFAYAESYDETAARYRGLRTAMIISTSESDAALLVRPDVARRQFDAEIPAPAPAPVVSPGPGPVLPPPPGPAPVVPPPPSPGPVVAPRPRRFHGAVTLDSSRVGRDASRIADEVITHLVGLLGANVRVTLEIEADIPSGMPDNVVHTVTENSRTLKFTQAGFEEE